MRKSSELKTGYWQGVVPLIDRDTADYLAAARGGEPDDFMRSEWWDQPALAPLTAYLERIEARVRSFNKFAVGELVNGYWQDIATIQIHFDGEIESTDPLFTPTDDEQQAITNMVNDPAFAWPDWRRANEQQAAVLAREAGVPAENIFPIWDRPTDSLAMVFIRHDFDDGRKCYLPWTLWDEQGFLCWHRTEPPIPLGMYKPRHPTGRKKVMVHEGPNKAAAAERIVQGDPSHPWHAELKEFEHWSLTTGAYGALRMNLDEMKQAGFEAGAYMCDNDQAGIGPARIVSRAFGGSFDYIRYDASWDAKWDIARPIPEKKFAVDSTGANRYIGPTLAALSQPGTWMVHAIEPKQDKDKIKRKSAKPKLIYILSGAGANEWSYIDALGLYINGRYPNQHYSEDLFNRAVRPFSDVDNTSKHLHRSLVSKVSILEYDPARPPGRLAPANAHEGASFNTYAPSAVVAAPDYKAADAEPWNTLLEHLFPVPTECAVIKKWCATLINKPQVRLKFHICSITRTQGVGRSTWADVLMTILGRHNCGIVTEANVASQYTDWQAHKRLIVIPEMHNPRDNSTAYRNLKSAAADEYITVNKKYVSSYVIANRLAMIALSNHPRALHIEQNDRRWFFPETNERRKPAAWWRGFHRWLNEQNGYAIIAAWAESYVNENGAYGPWDDAPASEEKDRATEEAFSAGMQRAYDLFKRLMEKHGGAVQLDAQKNTAYREDGTPDAEQPKTAVYFFMRDVQDYIRHVVYKGQDNGRMEKPYTLAKMAQRAGWQVGKKHLWKGDERVGPVISNVTAVAQAETMAALRAAVAAHEGGVAPVSTDVMDMSNADRNAAEQSPGARATDERKAAAADEAKAQAGDNVVPLTRQVAGAAHVDRQREEGPL
jgi:hypothetical protein